MATLETGDSFEPGELRESGGGGGGYEEIEYDVEEDLEGDLSQENGVNEAFVKLANGKTPTKTLSQKTLSGNRMANLERKKRLAESTDNHGSYASPPLAPARPIQMEINEKTQKMAPLRPNRASAVAPLKLRVSNSSGDITRKKRLSPKNYLGSPGRCPEKGQPLSPAHRGRTFISQTQQDDKRTSSRTNLLSSSPSMDGVASSPSPERPPRFATQNFERRVPTPGGKRETPGRKDNSPSLQEKKGKEVSPRESQSTNVSPRESQSTNVSPRESPSTNPYLNPNDSESQNGISYSSSTDRDSDKSAQEEIGIEEQWLIALRSSGQPFDTPETDIQNRTQTRLLQLTRFQENDEEPSSPPKRKNTNSLHRSKSTHFDEAWAPLAKQTTSTYETKSPEKDDADQSQNFLGFLKRKGSKSKIALNSTGQQTESIRSEQSSRKDRISWGRNTSLSQLQLPPQLKKTLEKSNPEGHSQKKSSRRSKSLEGFSDPTITKKQSDILAHYYINVTDDPTPDQITLLFHKLPKEGSDGKSITKLMIYEWFAKMKTYPGQSRQSRQFQQPQTTQPQTVRKNTKRAYPSFPPPENPLTPSPAHGSSTQPIPVPVTSLTGTSPVSSEFGSNSLSPPGFLKSPGPSPLSTAPPVTPPPVPTTPESNQVGKNKSLPQITPNGRLKSISSEKKMTLEEALGLSGYSKDPLQSFKRTLSSPLEGVVAEFFSKGEESDLLPTLLLTYPLIGSSSDLLSAALSSIENAKELEKFLKAWITTYWEDWGENSGKLASDLHDFLDETPLFDLPTKECILGMLQVEDLKSFRSQLLELQFGGETKNKKKTSKKAMLVLSPKKSIRNLPRNNTITSFSPYTDQNTNERPKDWSGWSEQEIADQLCNFHWNLLKEISPRQIIRWMTSKQKEKDCPQTWALTKNFNRLVYWVVSEIVVRVRVTERVSLLQKFVTIAYCCLQSNNFFAAKAIYSGVTHPAISRMTKTIAESSREKKTLFNKIQEVLSIDADNGAQYRSALKKASPPMIPYLGLHFKDMVFINDGNATVVGGQVNTQKLISLSKAVKNILWGVTRPYENVRKDDQMQLWFLSECPVLGDDQIWWWSQRVEPTNIEKAIAGGISTELSTLKEREQLVEEKEEREKEVEKLKSELENKDEIIARLQEQIAEMEIERDHEFLRKEGSEKDDKRKTITDRIKKGPLVKKKKKDDLKALSKQYFEGQSFTDPKISCDSVPVFFNKPNLHNPPHELKDSRMRDKKEEGLKKDGSEEKKTPRKLGRSNQFNLPTGLLRVVNHELKSFNFEEM